MGELIDIHEFRCAKGHREFESGEGAWRGDCSECGEPMRHYTVHSIEFAG